MMINDMKRIGAVCLIAWCCIFYGPAGSVHAASFDCKKAKAPIEIAICGDKDISALDEQLASKYKALLKTLDEAGKTVVKEGQKYWLKNIRGSAIADQGPRWTDTQKGDLASLKARYQKRVQDLDLKKMMVEGGYRILSGVYVQPTVVLSPIRDYEPVDALDKLKLEVIKEYLSVSLNSVGGTGNICSLEGVAKKQPDGSFLLTEQADGLSCRMTFAVKDRKIMVSQEGCETFCGAGAGFSPEFPLMGITSGK